jgi:hypothetical protein
MRDALTIAHNAATVASSLQAEINAIGCGPKGGLMDHVTWLVADERRTRSGEADYGCHWRIPATPHWFTWRVSVVLVTGEVYAERLHDKRMFMMGVLQPSGQRDKWRKPGPPQYETPGIHEAAEAWLKGWATERYYTPQVGGDLAKLCAHLGAVIPQEAMR